MYTTVQGDMWDVVSKKVYGSEKYVAQLMQANPQYISTVIFPGGVTLVTPAIDTAATAAGLPPWRR